ncbi:MAG TPA: DUF4350 domain-containing protein [Candidatus Angelobacter sp.]|nr:DUF4350 domain-containing protein [Candidatus Angelobacter sp.]
MRGVLRGPLAVLLVCLVVVGIAAAVLGRSSPSDTDPSSRSAGAAGTLALYEWLARLGLSVQRMSGDYTTSGADVLVAADPILPFTPQQADATVDMLRGGGELILTVDSSSAVGASTLLSRLGVFPGVTGLFAAGSGSDTTANATPAVPVDPGGLVRAVPVRPGVDFDPTPQTAPLLVVADQVVGIAVPVGSGRAYVLGSPYPLSNDGLHRGDSAQLVLSLIDRARGGNVVFDEVHHGETSSGGAGAALAGPVGLAGGLAAVIVVLYLAVSGRRLGRPLPARDPARVPSATEYVGAMGALIEHASQRGGIADRYAEELKQRVGRATGIDPHLDDAAFLGALESHDPTRAARVGAVLARCRNLAAARPGEAQLVALARDVDATEAEFAVGAATGLAESPR